MNVEITSYQLFSECMKEYGKGQLFFRTDGRQFEERRAAIRRAYLESHLQTSAEHRQAIAQAAVTPGMTKSEVSAAWGLLEEDTRMAFGHVTDDGRAAYAYFNGFAVGGSYGLYFKDDVVLGVRENDELVLPHEQELSMRLAEEYRGLSYFYAQGGSSGVTGRDIDLEHADWQRVCDDYSQMQPVVPCSRSMIEQHVRAKGLYLEYLAEVERLGLDREKLSETESARAALKVLPYPPLPPGPDEQGIEGYPSPPRGVPYLPPEEWFWYVGSGRPRQAVFPSIDGKVELLNVQWIKERLFRVNQIPLRVNGVSQFDQVEVEWLIGDPIPRFQRVVWTEGYRTVRLVVEGQEEGYLNEFIRTYIERPYKGKYRYEDGVLALTAFDFSFTNECLAQIELLGATLIHTDNSDQE